VTDTAAHLPGTSVRRVDDDEDDPHGLTVERWHRMASRGATGSEFGAELLDGEVIYRLAETDRHAESVRSLSGLLSLSVPSEVVVSVGRPLVLDERSEPRPDIALLRPGHKSGSEDPTEQPEVLLVVEVAESSLVFDRGRKAAYYARSGVPETWIVDIAGEQVLVMRRPASGGYRDIRNLRRGSTLEVEAWPSIRCDVAVALPHSSEGS